MKSFRQNVIILVCFLFSFSHSCFSENTLVYYQKGGVYEYRVKLLELALEKTKETDGKGSAVPFTGEVTQARGLAMLQEGLIDIVSLGTTKEWESQFTPIKIDILRGILGYRVCLINADRQKDFVKVQTIEDMRHFTGGFGEQWSDIAILRENKLLVEGVTNTSSILPMLVVNRFDYFPRGINEAWVEFEANKEKFPSLAVETHIAFFYPFPVYFFVKKGNTLLADRIRRGLNTALKDGSFKKLFLRYHKDIISKANLDNRKIIRMSNSTLPDGTPSVDTSWWFTERK